MRSRKAIRRWIVPALIAAMMCTCTACGGSKKAETPAATEAVAKTEAVTEAEVTEAATEEMTEAPETEASAVTYPITAEFTEGYTKADYAKYTDEDQAESLKGDKIWIEGAIVETETVDIDGFGENVLVWVIQQEDGEQWCAFVNKMNQKQENKKFVYNYSENGVGIAGLYIAVTDDGTPLVLAHKVFQVKTGETTASPAFANYTYTQPTAETTAEETESSKKDKKSSGISKEFKKAMDEYEEFFDEYVKFMKNYDATDASQLMQYMTILTKYSETMSSFEEWEDKEMTDEEAAYYAEVSLRISEKLLKALS